jgi:AraC-like DNA-binding protein
VRIFETALLRGPRFLVEQSEAWGVPRGQLLREAGLRPRDITDPDARISIAKLADLWRAIIFHFPGPDLGVRLGSAFDIRKGGLVGYLSLHSPDLRTALERLVRFSRILNEAVRPRFRSEGERHSLSWVPSPYFRPYPQVVDWALSALLTSLRQTTGTDFQPVEVRFPYDEPRPVPPTHLSHFGSALRFKCHEAGLVFSTDQLALELESADTELSVYLERHAQHVLEGMSLGEDLVERVRGQIWDDFRRGRPTVEGIAVAMGMSARSLQRRLHAEGTSFAGLRDDMLSHLATSMLRDRDLAIHEIAFLLGYSEPSTFYRAFRRWQKTSPVAYRAAS